MFTTVKNGISWGRGTSRRMPTGMPGQARTLKKSGLKTPIKTRKWGLEAKNCSSFEKRQTVDLMINKPVSISFWEGV